MLVSDDLFRAAKLETRKQYVALVESVEENGGDVKVFSSQHYSGQRKILHLLRTGMGMEMVMVMEMVIERF